MKKFNPYWPENIIIVGAGATFELGMQTTTDLGKTLLILAYDDGTTLTKKIDKAFPNSNKKVKTSLEQVLRILDGEDIEDISYLSKKRIKELRDIYDWSTVKQIVKRCPGVSNNLLEIQDVYNMIDMHLQSGHGFMVENQLVRPERMNAARNTINMLLAVIHTEGYRHMLKEKREVYKQYYEFARILAQLMRDEGVEKASKYPFNVKDFYLFSYAVISMNWDPLFLWIIFNAHKEINEMNAPYIGTPSSPMKLFHDMAHFMAVRSIGENTPNAWFPMNETSVQRLNDPEHQTGRRVRIGKFYFPHGCHGFRECPNCGKLTFYLGDEWNVDSETLFPPQIVEALAYKKPRSEDELDAHKRGVLDAVQCSHCNTITEAHHSAIVMQTNFKGNHPPFIEEIQRDMKVSIEKAKHIILFGYSFPQDDFIYRSIFATRKQMGENAPKCTIINFDPAADDIWMYKEEMDEFINRYPASALTDMYIRMIPLFGGGNIRVYGKGIPAVFMQNEVADMDRVKKLMEWERDMK